MPAKKGKLSKNDLRLLRVASRFKRAASDLSHTSRTDVENSPITKAEAIELYEGLSLELKLFVATPADKRKKSPLPGRRLLDDLLDDLRAAMVAWHAAQDLRHTDKPSPESSAITKEEATALFSDIGFPDYLAVAAKLRDKKRKKKNMVATEGADSTTEEQPS